MKRIDWRYRFMIAVLAIAAYAPTLKLGFLWDDHVTIEANPSITAWSVDNLKHDFSIDVFNHHGDRYYRPTSTLLNRLDYTLWGMRPFGFHLTNLLLHIGNALLTAELILALGFTPLAAFLTGSLLSVHPIVVEQLMIVAGRAELMAFFFTLLTLWLFLQESWVALVCGVFTYGLGLLSKESVAITPALLGLVYYYRQEPVITYKRLIPLILLLFPYIWLRTRVVGPLLDHSDLWLTTRFFIQEFPHVLWRYLELLLIPWNLHSHRLLPHLTPAWPVYLIALIVIGGALVLKYRRLAVLCLGWFVLSLLPKTPVMIYGNFMLDHWVYPASLALFLPLALIVEKGWKAQYPRIRSITAFVYFSVLIVWALLVHLNVALRGTDEKMYRWALHFTSSNPIKYNLGVLLVETGRPQEALEYLNEVRSVYPEDANALNALALAYVKLGHPKIALHLLEAFAHAHPDDHLTQKHLQLLRGRRDGA